MFSLHCYQFIFYLFLFEIVFKNKIYLLLNYEEEVKNFDYKEIFYCDEDVHLFFHLKLMSK